MDRPTIKSKRREQRETLLRAPSRTLYDRVLLQDVLLIPGASSLKTQIWSHECEQPDHQLIGNRWCFEYVTLAPAEPRHSKYRYPELERVFAAPWNQNDPLPGRGVL